MPSGIDVNLFQLSSEILDDISVVLNKSIVFLDNAFAEIIHWHGSATKLFNCGVLDIREFSSFEVRLAFFYFTYYQ